MKFFTFVLLLFIINGAAQAQYVLDPEVVILPDAKLDVESTSLPLPSIKEDTKSVGMGKTGIAFGKTYNGMLYNPALLSRKRFMLDAVSLSLSLPPETYDAANYLNDHFSEFKEAVSLKEVWAGIEEFKNAADITQQLTALRKVQDGLKFPRDLFQQIIGTPENPLTHGIRTIPSIAVQYDNFGFTLYGVAQSAFQVEQSPVLDALLDVPLPDDLNDPQQVANAMLALEGVLQPIFELNDFEEALPFAYSISYVDIVGAFGYAHDFMPNFSAGANLKVVHRRFSAR
ncbi:MAG: hypothetical protein EHM47_09305, partial [Ignavibacteriales bacterium]